MVRGRQAQCTPINVPKQEKWLVLPTKRQRADARASSASIHMGCVPEITERHFWMSLSTVLCTDSLGAGKGNESFTGGIQQARAPSCPLPLSCSQIMHKVRMRNSMKELGTLLPYKVKKEPIFKTSR